jgi:NACHT domain
VDWNLDSFLGSNNSIAVIGAPFGIGKSSLATKIAHDCAIKFIENPTDSMTYIPIFVPLRFALESTCNDNSLENDLERITSISSRKDNTNILVILDGLDELPDDNPVSIHNIHQTIKGFIKGFPNRKFIITTRLEAGFPGKLTIKEFYARLFSFNKEHIEQFFRVYGLQSEYHNLSNILTEQKLGKPEDVVRRDFQKWYKESKDEKKVLRLIAFLKNDRPSLSRTTVEDYLDSLGFNLPKSSESLMSTSFSTGQDERGMEKFEFTHKSFKEYLLAEFIWRVFLMENIID